MTQILMTTPPAGLPVDPRFNGSDYEHERDKERLANQLGRVFEAMKDGQWRTLKWLAETTGAPQASVSAQLRHLRKPRFGSYVIEKRHEGEGLYLYRLNGKMIGTPPTPPAETWPDMWTRNMELEAENKQLRELLNLRSPAFAIREQRLAAVKDEQQTSLF